MEQVQHQVAVLRVAGRLTALLLRHSLLSTESNLSIAGVSIIKPTPSTIAVGRCVQV